MDELSKEVVSAIGKEAYNDLAKPAAQSVGGLLGLVPRTIKALLLPLEKWIVQREHNLESTQKLLEEKLKDVPPEQLTEPEANIAVPALQYLQYCMDNETLRDMYANLLANSMNAVVKDGVHPAFVEIIKQLCPDEAKLLCYMLTFESIPLISVRYNLKVGGATKYNNFTNIGELLMCECPDRVNQFLDNLERLGLVKVAPPLTSLVDKTKYEPLKQHPFIKKLIMEMPDYFEGYEIIEGYAWLSEFGKSFCSICIDPDTEITIHYPDDNLEEAPTNESID